jgi:S1-C subfamily serine protease
MNSPRCFVSLGFVAALLGAAPAGLVAAEGAAAAGPALVQRFADAIVGVELVVTVKVKMGDREMPPREQRVEINGTVISPTGLTVTTLAGVDPQVQFDAMRASSMGTRGAELVGADFKEVKLRFADGKEVPAKFVLKDADLDLAFMAPETAEAGREFAHVQLDQAATGALLGRFYFVARASKALQRVPLVRASEVMGIVEKPRRLFLLTEQSPGTPMLDADGRVLGISLQHFANGRPSGIVVLPAGDIADIAKQAAAAMAR